MRRLFGAEEIVFFIIILQQRRGIWAFNLSEVAAFSRLR